MRRLDIEGFVWNKGVGWHDFDYTRKEDTLAIIKKIILVEDIHYRVTYLYRYI
jgi:hypothetical protein